MDVVVKPIKTEEIDRLVESKPGCTDYPSRKDVELGLYRFVNTPNEAWGYLSTLSAAEKHFSWLLDKGFSDVIPADYVIDSDPEHGISNSLDLDEYISGVRIGLGCICSLHQLPLKQMVGALKDLSIQAAEWYCGISMPTETAIELDGVH